MHSRTKRFRLNASFGRANSALRQLLVSKGWHRRSANTLEFSVRTPPETVQSSSFQSVSIEERPCGVLTSAEIEELKLIDYPDAYFREEAPAAYDLRVGHIITSRDYVYARNGEGRDAAGLAGPSCSWGPARPPH